MIPLPTAPSQSRSRDALAPSRGSAKGTGASFRREVEKLGMRVHRETAVAGEGSEGDGPPGRRNRSPPRSGQTRRQRRERPLARASPQARGHSGSTGTRTRPADPSQRAGMAPTSLSTALRRPTSLADEHGRARPVGERGLHERPPSPGAMVCAGRSARPIRPDGFGREWERTGGAAVPCARRRPKTRAGSIRAARAAALEAPKRGACADERRSPPPPPSTRTSTRSISSARATRSPENAAPYA